MPELPEVEAVCRKLRAQALGAQIVTARVLRPSVTAPQSARTLEKKAAGRTIEAVRRRAKNILIDLSGGLTMRVHLRMTGNLYVIPDVRFHNHFTRAWFELGGGRGLIYEDSRVLGKIHLHPGSEIDSVLKGAGIEPLSEEFTPEWFIARARKSRQPAKLFLMDQKHVAGLGNIYAAEALWLAKIDPRKPLTRVSAPRLTALHAAIVSILRDAVESAYIAYTSPSGFAEGDSFPVEVYDREGEPCRRCQRPIRRIPQGGRSTYFCSGCQK